MTGRVYLDHAATSPMVPQAIEAVAAELGRAGNASSLHGSGQAARNVLEEARESIAADLGADPVEVIFTSGGTEADNLALQGAWQGRARGLIGVRNRLVISAVEHPAVAETADALAAAGADVQRIGVDEDCVIDLVSLSDLLAVPTLIVSVMAVNNETGTRQLLDEVVRRAHAAEALVHSDAVQLVGHGTVDFAASGLDLVSVSAHKFGGPVGIGALLATRGLPLRAYAHGGGQERDLRSGTAAPALAAGFAAALRRAAATQDSETRRLTRLGAELEAACAAIPGYRRNGRPGSPAILNVSFPGARADDLLMLLDAEGIDVSTGSACTAGVSQPSEVLLAMGRDGTEASESLRFSLGWSTTSADIARVAAVLPDVVGRARAAGRVD